MDSAVFSEWWNANVEDVIAEAVRTGGVPNDSDAYTINGQTGDFFPCSANETTRILVERGKTYLLRIVNCAMLHSYFFKIANHPMTLVAVDAEYTKPYKTDVLLTNPGNTMDVLITAECSNTSVPVLLTLPVFNDTATATKFSSNLRSLNPSVPNTVDVEMLITEGLALVSCPNNSCAGINGGRAVGAFNNISYVQPNISILQAYYFGIDGVYTTDFPDNPPTVYNYTGTVPLSLWEHELGIKVKVLKFNSVVQIVFQNTGIITIQNHPIHLHGHNFYVMGQGFGNYNAKTDPAKLNLVDAPFVNTHGVPAGGWAVIRFTADNPGAWLMHCHFESHSELGFDMVFITKDGPRNSDKLQHLLLIYPNARWICLQSIL
ncbi:hypothetical protein SUGI_0578920 [Cryptomeria japonica]|nr:hypothetical protein SUGI_0578920 [Cryptomeria japonica]